MPDMAAELRDKVWTPSQEQMAKEKDWISDEIERIGIEKLHELAFKAKKVRENAYKPHSGYAVGSALLAKSGQIYVGCNNEVSNFTGTGHGETAAVSRAIGDGEIKRGSEKFIDAIAVCHEAESGPCGSCRQTIAQHAENCLILDVDPKGKIIRITSLGVLLPYSFTSSSLKS